MAVTKLSNSTFTGLNKYDSFLAGNPAYVPTAYESIATVSPSGVGTVSFTSIPSSYQHLQIRFHHLGGSNNLNMRFNGDTGNNYNYHYLVGTGAGTTVYAGGGGPSSSMNVSGLWNGGNSTYPSPGIIDILDYTDTNKFKTMKALQGMNSNTTGEMALSSGAWRSTAAIDSITFVYSASSTFSTGCTFALYGIK